MNLGESWPKSATVFHSFHLWSAEIRAEIREKEGKKVETGRDSEPVR
jgi:hypothetical protein